MNDHDAKLIKMLRDAGQYVLIDFDGSPLAWDFEKDNLQIWFDRDDRKILDPTRRTD